MATRQEKIEKANEDYLEIYRPAFKDYQEAIGPHYEKFLDIIIPAIGKRDKIIAEAKDD